MFNREYQKRATRQAMRVSGAWHLYRPMMPTRTQPSIQPPAQLDLFSPQPPQHSADEPLKDIFPEAYE